MNIAVFVSWYLPIQFFFSQNDYFGWNRLPKSDFELIADGITLLLVAMAIIVTAIRGPK